RLLASGALYPERPRGVPADAWYTEDAQTWETGVVWGEKGLNGRRMRWSNSGTLRLVESLREGKRHGFMQSFDDDGALLWEAYYDDGRLSGAFRMAGVVPGHFADERVRGQRGSFLDDQAVERWQLLDQGGATLQERDLGVPLDAAALAQSPVLLGHQQPAEAWRVLARQLFAERRVGEGLLAAARAVARAGVAADLLEALSERTMLLGGDGARGEAAQAVERSAANPTDAPVILIDALKRGGEASTLLWTLAKALPDHDQAALDLLSAALILSPEATEPLATRTLLHATLGHLAAARADVERLSASSPEQAAFLDQYLRIYFPRFAFWPAAETFPGAEDELPLVVARTREEVVQVIRRYATRLGRLREALQQRLADQEDNDDNDDDNDDGNGNGNEAGNHAASEAAAAFMIPDLAGLLPDGPLPLTRWTFEMSAEEYGGTVGEEEAVVAGQSETMLDDGNEAAGDDGRGRGDDELPSSVQIAVDETLGVDPVPAAILSILRRARADWSGLVWLSWAVGLDAPGLPQSLQPPPTFGRAAVMTMERVWRCRDKLRTSGLLALTKGIPGFEWEGTTIDELPAALADVVLDEYVEARAIFSWLCDPANRSPWQEDLRTADD
ncbi:MAG: hypothetical protein ABJA82_12275, partial [Myxococcales bacterium]